MNFLRIAARVAFDSHSRIAKIPLYHVKDVKRRCRGLKVRLPIDIAPRAKWEEPSWLYTGPVNDAAARASLISKLEAKGLVVSLERVLVEYWPDQNHRDNNYYTFIRIDRDNTPAHVDKPRTEVD